MRLLLDTHIYVYMVNEPDRLTRDVRTLLEDTENMLYLSSESVHELITLYRSKGTLKKKFHSERELIDYVLHDYAITTNFRAWIWLRTDDIFLYAASWRHGEKRDNGVKCAKMRRKKANVAQNPAQANTLSERHLTPLCGASGDFFGKLLFRVNLGDFSTCDVVGVERPVAFLRCRRR